MLGDTLPKVAANAYYYSEDVIEQIRTNTSEAPKREMKCKEESPGLVWDQLKCLFDKQSENMPEHTKFKLLLRPKFMLLPPFKFEVPPSSKFEDLPRCKNDKKITELLGSDLRIEDCRPLKTRSPTLYKALNEGNGTYREIVSRLNKFGMRSTISLNPYMSNATEHLDAYFDKYLITDSFGQAIFNSDDAGFLHSDEIQTPHRKAIAFTNHEDIYRLLRMEEAKLTDVQQRSAPIGSSALKSLRVGDVELSIFIHPFTIQGISGGGEAISRKEKKGNGRDDSSDQSEVSAQSGDELIINSSVFHIIGIVTTADLRREAVRLELGMVVNATLLICAGIALLPIVWFWTAGNRLLIGRWVPCLLGASSVLVLLFYTVMFLGHVTRNTDKETLDQTLIGIAQHIVKEFNTELKDGHRKLIKWHQKPGFKKSDSKLERNFFCPEKDNSECKTDGDIRGHLINAFGRNLNRRNSYLSKYSGTIAALHDDIYEMISSAENAPKCKIPRFTAIFSLNKEGKQIKCQFNRRKSKTPKLPLEFRPYFKEPHEGKSWAVDPSLKFDDNGKDNVECPYFLDRIDSIIRGDKATVLSMPVSDKPGCMNS